MRYATIVIVIMVFLAGFPGIACEKNMRLDGLNWTFHRMPDGNSYHEVKNLGEFTEGQSLQLSAPCAGRSIDTFQVSWEDRRSEVFGELITMPGNRKHGKRDISDKRNESWTVGKPTDSVRLVFSGKRGHRCRVRWIRIYYGVDAPSYHQEISAVDTVAHDLIDRIGLHDGKIQKKARILRWNGQHLTVAIKTNSGQETRQFRPDEIKNILFSERWGQAVDRDGNSFPVRAKRMVGNKIELDKNLDGAIVPKPLIEITHYKSIEF
jgi:hypothetical protein